MGITTIEWTATYNADGSVTRGYSWNPWIGCTHVSPGCEHCYAETLMDQRYGRAAWGKGKARVRTSAANWWKPLAWNKKAGQEGRRPRVFCASLADVFDPEVSDSWRSSALEVMEQTPALDWLVLTKRPHLVTAMVPGAWMQNGFPRNVWIGTSVEDQRRADERIPHLLRVPARVRFLSCEPLLGPVDVSPYLCICAACARGEHCGGGIHWVIVGGESGPGARPMHPAWARSLRDHCWAAGIPFFFKQHGAYVADSQVDRTVFPDPQRARARFGTLGSDGSYRDGAFSRLFPMPSPVCVYRVGKHAAGRLLDGREWNEVPQPHMLLQRFRQYREEG